MTRTRQYFLYFPIVVFFVSAFLFSHPAFSQITVFERPTDTGIVNTGLFYESPKRLKISLNGEWDASFNDGASFSKVLVPISYSYNGAALFRKNVNIDRQILDNFNFILVAEGIGYEGNIKINNVFIAQNAGAYSSIVTPVDKGIITENNLIEIAVNSELDGNSIPLSNLINYGKNYGGISKDIYLVAVPKCYVFNSHIISTLEGNVRAKISNRINIRSFDIGGIQRYTYKTVIKTAATGETVKETEPAGFSIENFRSELFENEIVIDNPNVWSPQTPFLYIVSTVIMDSAGNVVDVFNAEYGLRDIKFKKDFVLLNGQQMYINGTNYHEDSYRHGSALDYREVERDLTLIKETGFNCIRVEGSTAHPYIVNLCNRLGLFLFQEIPFNDVPERLLEDEEYIKHANDYLTDVITRDRNAACIIAWGIGNNFDVTKNVSAEYVKEAKELAAKLDFRPVYYTSFNIDNDVCKEFVTLKGLCVTGKNVKDIKGIVESVTAVKNQKNAEPSYFIASFGYRISNENRNGYSDMHSVEAQSKYLTEVYTEIFKKFWGNFVSSFSDYRAERPFNFRLNGNPYMNTNGIFTIHREPKQSAQYVKKLLNSQEQPKILEGNNPGDSSYIFIVIGIIVNIIFLFLFTNLKRLKDGIWRSLYRPTNFFQFASEERIIPITLNIILSLLISIGISLFVSGIFYLYRDNVYFDMILSNIFYSERLKIWFSDIVSSPVNAVISFTLINFILQFWVTLLIYTISVFLRGRVFFKNLYTVSVWAAMPMIIFLPLGTVIYKLGMFNPEYVYLSLILFVIMHVVYVIRLVKGVNVIFDTSTLKTYLYAAVVILIIYGGLFTYLYFFRTTFATIDLVRSYLAN
jgi:hypothetical protein